MELERAIASRVRSGSLGLDDAIKNKMFDELLLVARPTSVRAFNQLLTAVSRSQGRGSSTSALVVSLFNRMARASPNKVAPDGFTYSTLICCFCRMGRLELGLASFGLVLKVGWRVGIVINLLLKGLCDAKRVDEAMEILSRRMPEFGCTPNVFSYNTVLKGLCDEKRVDETLELLHVMADDGGGSCPPNVVSYNTIINGLFRDGQVDKAYNLFREMDDRGIFLTVVIYNTVIDGLCKAQAVDRAKGVLQQMIHKGVKPDK